MGRAACPRGRLSRRYDAPIASLLSGVLYSPPLILIGPFMQILLEKVFTKSWASLAPACSCLLSGRAGKSMMT